MDDCVSNGQIHKIVSGAQTGVDRAALDAAIAKGVPIGGWVPKGRAAEDGVIPEQYSMAEMPTSGYRQRTKKNVLDSDGTVIIYFSYLTGGTELTVHFCIQNKQPYVLIDADELSVSRAAKKIDQFIHDKNIQVMNVAGPRASGHPQAYDFTLEVILQTLNLSGTSTDIE
jgi:hypothetical protein